MVETYEPTPYEDRPSQKVGLAHFLKEIAPILGVSALGAGGGWLAGKLRLVKWTPGMAAAIGGKVSGIITAFMVWQKKEKEKVGIEAIRNDIKSVDHLHQTDADLERDNRFLEKMIAFERQRSQGGFAERVAAEAESRQSSPRRPG